jgi:WD40 repeat protein
MLPENPAYQVRYQVRALALSPDNQKLVSAGSKNTLALWDWTRPAQPPRLLLPQGREEDYIWDAIFAPQGEVLATSDSRGFITLWDLKHCSVSEPDQPLWNCPQQQHWRAVKGEGNVAVRRLKFSADGTHLVSAGDDGRVMLWNLTETLPNGKVLFTSPEKISAVDVLETEQDLLVLSGGDDRQVRLHRIRTLSSDANRPI